MAIYMKWDGIDGAVTTAGLRELDRAELVPVGCRTRHRNGGARRGEPRGVRAELSEIVVTKRMDMSSTKLFMDAVAGELNTTVKIQFTTTTKDNVDTFPGLRARPTAG